MTLEPEPGGRFWAMPPKPERRNEQIEYYAALVDPTGKVAARSETQIVPVTRDCRVQLDPKERGVAENLTVGETSPQQQGKKVLGFLCDGVVTRVNSANVRRSDEVCRACVDRLVAAQGGADPAPSPASPGSSSPTSAPEPSPSRPPSTAPVTFFGPCRTLELRALSRRSRRGAPRRSQAGLAARPARAPTSRTDPAAHEETSCRMSLSSRLPSRSATVPPRPRRQSPDRAARRRARRPRWPLPSAPPSSRRPPATGPPGTSPRASSATSSCSSTAASRR